MLSALAYVLFVLMGTTLGYLRSARVLNIMQDDGTAIDLRNLHLVTTFAGYFAMAAVLIRNGPVAFLGFALVPHVAGFWFFGTQRASELTYPGHKLACLASLAFSLSVAAICFSGALGE